MNPSGETHPTRPVQSSRRLIDAYLRRRGLPGASPAGAGQVPPVPGDASRTVARNAAVVVFDRRYRVELSPWPQGGVMLRARLMLLPMPGAARDAAVLRLGRMALWSARRHPAYCAVDTRARAAWLQHVVEHGAGAAEHPGMRAAVDPDSDIDIDAFAQGLGQFVDVLAAWRDVLEQPDVAAAERGVLRPPPFFMPA